MHYPEIISLDDYDRPEGPTVNRLEDWYESLRKKIVDRDTKTAVTEDQLSKASLESIRSFTAEPDCEFIFQALDKAYLEWINSAETDDHLRLLVFPPCDRANRVANWAERNGIDTLNAPDRTELFSRDVVDVAIPAGDGPLVIPKLEDWFIRHRRGLRHVRALLTALQRTARPCLVSCTSWSWTYLKSAANADLVLPAPDSLAPFDAENLGLWLLDLLSQESNEPVTFRDYQDGKKILCRDKDGKVSDTFLQQLADDSGGVPWIAWQLWRRSLRTEAEAEDEDEDKTEDEDSKSSGEDESDDRSDKARNSDDSGMVFWVLRSQPLTLPAGHERTACLLLHALLIHGSLPEQFLSAVLPSIGETNLVIALIRSGFVERHDGEVRCLAAAYPAIWTALVNSGITMAPF